MVAEKWIEAVQGLKEAGVEMHYKLDQQLFRRSTRGASKVRVHKGEYADDVVLVASSREAAEAAGRAYVDVTKALGLTVNLSKTKFMVVRCGVTEEDKLPPPLEDDGDVEWVSEFPYLGSVVAKDGQSHVEVDKRIANASKAFGALRRAVFMDKHLSVTTKRLIYDACVLSVLLYGSECWVPLRRDLKNSTASTIGACALC